MTKPVIFPKIEENGVIIYPDDVSKFANTHLSHDGLSMIADYSGNLDLPIYVNPQHEPHKLYSHIAFRMMLPPLLRGVVSHPALAATLPNIGNDPVKIAQIAVFADCIRDARAPLPDGGFGVDLDDPLTKMGLMQAVEFGLITQAEMDEILK